MQVVRVSGTIKKSEEEAIRRARVAILKAKRDAAGSATEGLNAILGPIGADSGIGLLGQEGIEAPAPAEDDNDVESGFDDTD